MPTAPCDMSHRGSGTNGEISECPPPHRAPRKHSLRGWFWAGVGYNNHPAGIAGTPPQRGTLSHNWTYPVPLHWRGARRAGWSESARMCPYSLYSVIPAPRAPHNKHSVIPAPGAPTNTLCLWGGQGGNDRGESMSRAYARTTSTL